MVAATDGLWDNMFEHEVLAFVAEAQKSRKGPRALAKMLAVLAQRRGADGSVTTPVAVDAKAAGREWKGGRRDDITVMAIYVVGGQDVRDGVYVDYCDAQRNICGSMGTCVRLSTGYSCQCTEGYGVKTVGGQQTCVDIDECADGQHCVGGWCENTIGSYKCTCKPGQLPFKNKCQNPDECSPWCNW